MAPFDMYFTFSRWDVLNKNQANISNLDPNEIIRVNSMSIEQVKDEIKQSGVNKYNPKKEKILALFLNEYFTNYNKVGYKKKPILSLLCTHSIQSEKSLLNLTPRPKCENCC